MVIGRTLRNLDYKPLPGGFNETTYIRNTRRTHRAPSGSRRLTSTPTTQGNLEEECPRLTLPMGTPDEDDHGWLTQSAHGLTIIRVPTHRFEDYVETIPGLRLRDILCIELARDEATDRGYAWVRKGEEVQMMLLTSFFMSWSPFSQRCCTQMRQKRWDSFLLVFFT